jgi:hypothetical protein
LAGLLITHPAFGATYQLNLFNKNRGLVLTTKPSFFVLDTFIPDYAIEKRSGPDRAPWIGRDPSNGYCIIRVYATFFQQCPVRFLQGGKTGTGVMGRPIFLN